MNACPGGAGLSARIWSTDCLRAGTVTVVDDLSTGRRPPRRGAGCGAELVELDIRDAAGLAALAAERGPRRSSTGRPDRRRKSLADPPCDAVNVGATPRLRRRAAPNRRSSSFHRRRHLRRGRGQQLPLDEGTAIAPLSPTGRASSRRGLPRPYQRLYGSRAWPVGSAKLRPRQDPLGEAGWWRSSAAWSAPAAPTITATAPRP